MPRKKNHSVFSIFEKDQDHWKLLQTQNNQTQVFWGMIAAYAIGRGDADYRIRAFYVEYENVASPGDPVTVPGDVPLDEGVDYYLSLSGSRDFLRVPVVGLAGIDPGSGYEEFFTGSDHGNRISLQAVSSGSVGVLGRPFSDTVNSTVCGLAIVATPDWDDITQDLVFARGYYAADKQVPKAAGRQLAFSWNHTFETSGIFE